MAEHLGVDRLDTGAMYRAVAALALERGHRRPTTAPPVAALAAAPTIEVGRARHHRRPRRHRRHPLARGRAGRLASWRPTPRCGASWCSASGPGPRRTAGGWSRAATSARSSSREAEVKVYLTASPEERARRRHDEAPEGVARRDRIDSTRDASPLREADDAHRLDTTGRTVQDVVEEVLSWL